MTGVEPLERELAAAVGELQVLARRLAFPLHGQSVQAEFAALDAFGTLWLVAQAAPDLDRALLDALGLLACAREHAAEFGAGEVRVALCAGPAARELAERAAPLADVVVFELQSWSADGVARRRCVQRSGTRRGQCSVDELRASLPDGQRALFDLADARLARIDGELERVARPTVLAWRARGRELARVALADGALELRSGPRFQARLQTPADLEPWLAAVLELHFEPPADADGLAPLPEREAPARLDPGEPLLSAEELAAFRD